MNTENEKRLDDLFKKKLEDPVDEIRYEEGDWDALEQMMDTPKRRGIIHFWPILSAVAALLLLFLGWWAFRPQAGVQGTKGQEQAVAGHKKADTILEHSQIAVQHKNTDTIIETKASQLQAAAHHQAIDTILEHKTFKQPVAPAQKNSNQFNNDRSLFASGQSKKDTIIEKANNTISRVNDGLIVALNTAPVINSGSPGAGTVKQVDLPRPAAAWKSDLTAPGKVNKGKAKTEFAYRPQYTLSVVAAPDLNGVGSFQQSKVGTNIGMTFAVGISRKLTVSTGALYSVKPYLTNFSNYNTGSTYKWAVNPINVTADCRMLDIPLNVAYQVYHKQQNKISLGTGLSSYLMLHESYKFNYEYGGAQGPASYTVPNPGKYFFGVVNLNATYERQLNSKVGLSIQPYLKLPLSNVGYSQVKLQTTGVAIGLSWNLNSLTKP